MYNIAMDFKIKKANYNSLSEENFKQICEIEQSAGGYLDLIFDKNDMKYFLRSESYTSYIVLYENSVIGFIIYNQGYYLNDDIYIIDVGVAESYRKRNIATNLIGITLQQLVKKDKSIKFLTLDVETTNEKAIKLYEKIGMKKSAIKSKNGKNNYCMIGEISEILKNIADINEKVKKKSPEKEHKNIKGKTGEVEIKSEDKKTKNEDFIIK